MFTLMDKVIGKWLVLGDIDRRPIGATVEAGGLSERAKLPGVEVFVHPSDVIDDGVITAGVHASLPKILLICFKSSLEALRRRRI